MGGGRRPFRVSGRRRCSLETTVVVDGEQEGRTDGVAERRLAACRANGSQRLSQRTVTFPVGPTGLPIASSPFSIIRPLPLSCSYRSPGTLVFTEYFCAPPCRPPPAPTLPPQSPLSLLDHPERTAIYQTPALSHAPSWRARLRFSFSKVTRHVTKHIGVGIVCSVAYFDP